MGNNNTINQNKIIEEIKDKNSQYLYCPFCFLIPSIKPFLMKGELFISFYCKCLYDKKEYLTFDSYTKLITNDSIKGNFCEKHKSVKGLLFCITCEKWLCDNCITSHKDKFPNHIYNKVPIRLKEYCHKHEKELAVGYCYKCGINVCQRCLEENIKLRHEIFIHDNKENNNRINKKWNNFMDIYLAHSTLNDKMKGELINLIQNDNNITDEEKKAMVNKIINSYRKNKHINNQLGQFILFLFSNYNNSFDIGKIVNCNIFFNIFNLKFENAAFSIEPQISSISNAENLIDYYNNIHIIQLSPLINVKNMSSEKKSVENQISKICVLDGNNAATLISTGIIIVWNYLTYEELYRIKNITVKENNLQNDFTNTIYNANTINHINNIHNFFLDEYDNDNDINEIIRQQTNILNQIQNQNNINNQENKRINLIKVFNINNSVKNKSCLNNEYGQNYNEIFNQNDNINKINEIEEEDLELNLNFISMTYIKKYKLLALIIENCKDIYLFDLTKKEGLKKKLKGHKKEVLDILTLKNDNLASYGNDFAIRIWNMKNLQNFITINVEIKKYYIYFTELLYGNLIFASDESMIKMLKLPEYEFDKDITCVKKPMNYFELPDKKLIIACNDHYVRILKPPDYKEVTLLFNRTTNIYSFLLMDSQRLLVCLKDNSLHIMFLNKKKQKKNMQLVSTFYSPVGSLVKTNDERIISVSWDNVVKVFLITD